MKNQIMIKSKNNNENKLNKIKLIIIKYLANMVWIIIKVKYIYILIYKINVKNEVLLYFNVRGMKIFEVF